MALSETPSAATDSAITEPKPKRKGQPRFVPTEPQRALVRVMAATCIPQDFIATLIINPVTGSGIYPWVLRKHFRDELDRGHLAVKAYVINKLFQLINDGDRASIMFYLKTQCGWREREHGPGIEDETAAGLPAIAQRGQVIDVTPLLIPDDPVLAAQIYQQMMRG